jgi:YVTN family beta-propeller protein
MWSGELVVFKIDDQRFKQVASIPVGFHPCDIAISDSGDRAYAGLVATGQVAEVDLTTSRLVRRIDVGAWPRYLTLSQDGTRLAVGCSGDSKIAVVDTQSGEMLYDVKLANGVNFGHMATSPDGQHAYFTWMVYRTNPISVRNIQQGWILASRIGRVRLDGPAYREAMSLDVPGKAIGDPHGIVISRDAQHLIASASGTHELLVYRLADLPMVGTGGPGDLIDRRLEKDRDRFDRIPLGGRPMGMAIASDNRTVYVANFLRNSVQVVDVVERQVTREIALGGSQEPETVQRKGMALFYDAGLSLDQWYSCHSCHVDGGSNSRPMDTMNDGSEMTYKAVLPLFNVHQTGPWTWHGWQKSLADSVRTSVTSTMIGTAISDQDTEALLEYMKTLQPPPNPFRKPDGSLSDAAKRGQQIFQSAKAGCVECHQGPLLTDGLVHDVGLGSDADVYDGYNTPSLLGLHNKVQWLHSGRARTLERVVADLHSPQKVIGGEELTSEDTADLIEYLKSL